MKKLQDLATNEAVRPEVVADCVALVNSEVKSKKGIGGVAVKAAFAVVKAIKPHILEDSVDGLLDDFVAALQPFYEMYQGANSKGTLEALLIPKSDDVAEALLAITDRRAERSTHKTMVKAYQKLRPTGKEHVRQAVPGIGQVLDKHITKL